jgi:hypothetical protein
LGPFAAADERRDTSDTGGERFQDGRGWFRTSDLSRVKQALTAARASGSDPLDDPCVLARGAFSWAQLGAQSERMS